MTRMKQFEYDTSRYNPLTIAANKDTGETEVEAIIAHSGDPKRKSHMDFLVRWTGLDESENRWLPWSELLYNTALHAYLRTHNMHTLIPKV